jgi:hypothetical protein
MTNSYKELCTGLHYLDPNTGQWLESQEVIEGFPGGAVARQGQIQMVFANDLATVGAIDAQTPAGRFRSHLLCLSYADSALQTNVLIAEVTNCQGQIISPNQVLYPEAFSDGLSGSVRYTYRKSGWEQDIIINDPGTLPAPEAYGLDSSSPSLTLQVITEFVDPPTPIQTSQTITAARGSAAEDEDVDWGALRLGRGQALFLGGRTNAAPIPTTKRWVVTADHRHLLVEEVPFALLLKQILSKSQGASVQPRAGAVRRLASLKDLPRLQPAKATTKTMEYASAQLPERGLLLDYVTMVSTNAFTFQCDTTYYISGTVNLSGTTVFEGSTVIKFTNSPTAKISMSGPLVCRGGQYHPIVLTSKDDNSLGDTISGSTGNPTNYNGATYLEDNNSQTNTYQYLRLSYAGTGLSAAIFSNGVWHCQFVKCGTAVNATGSGQVALHNVLMTHCTNCIVTTGTLSAEHLTADQCVTLLTGAGSSGVLTNSLLTAVTAVTNVTLYNSARLSSGSGVYQTVGAASYYLADGSTNRNAGTTNINSTLLSDLAKRTTYPPIVLTNKITTDTTLSPQAQRDTDVPDLGYEYDPLDYVMGSVTVTNTLVLTNGVAIGSYGSPWLTLSGYGKLISGGSPCRMNSLVHYNAVQEQSTTNWAGGGWVTVTTSSANAVVQCSFTMWSSFGGMQGLLGSRHFNQTGTVSETNNAQSSFSHCEFTGASLMISAGSISLTNCLFERVYLSLSSGPNPYAWYLYNNLFRGGFLLYSISGSPPALIAAYDNLFDGAKISNGSGIFTNGYNAYVTNCINFVGCNNCINCSTLLNSQGNDQFFLNSPIYQTSYLGNCYYPTNGGLLSTLIDVGSRYATNAGLYHFTTTTNQQKEADTVVDIGFHYVAIDPNTGQPYDTDGDGVPDYLEDANGNGVVDSGETDWQGYNSPNGLTGASGLEVFTPLR